MPPIHYAVAMTVSYRIDMHIVDVHLKITISPDGVFLTGAALWYPLVGEGGLFTAALTVDLPEGWDAASQGARTLHELAGARRRVRWGGTEPLDDLRILRGKVVLLARILREVEEFHAAGRGPSRSLLFRGRSLLRTGVFKVVGGDVSVEHQFPAAHADRTAVGHGVDEDVLVWRRFARGDHRPDVETVERMLLPE